MPTIRLNDKKDLENNFYMIFGAYFTARGEFSVGGMVAVLNLLNYIVWPFSNIGAAISEWNQANVSVHFPLC